MANPLYKAFGGQSSNSMENFIQQFPKFVQSVKENGQNPNEILNGLVSSGKVSQQQLDAVQRQARQMSGMFDKFRGIFK